MPDITLSYDLILLLFATGLIAGGIDAVAGGGGLIALPVLLSTGLTPLQALATNKLQGSFGTLSASLHFVQRGLINLRDMRFSILATFIGAASGTLLVQVIDNRVLATMVPILLIGIAIYFLLSPSLSEEQRPALISNPGFALTVGFGVGFYDGFFGPGTGSFFAIGFIILLGMGLTQATASTKVLNLTSNLASLVIFAAHGDVVWSLGIAMGLGQLLGARLGAQLVITRGATFIKPLIVAVTVIISLRLLIQEFT